MTTHLPDFQPESQPNWKHGTPTAIFLYTKSWGLPECPARENPPWRWAFYMRRAPGVIWRHFRLIPDAV